MQSITFRQKGARVRVKTGFGNPASPGPQRARQLGRRLWSRSSWAVFRSVTFTEWDCLLFTVVPLDGHTHRGIYSPAIYSVCFPQEARIIKATCTYTIPWDACMCSPSTYLFPPWFIYTGIGLQRWTPLLSRPEAANGARAKVNGKGGTFCFRLTIHFIHLPTRFELQLCSLWARSPQSVGGYANSRLTSGLDWMRSSGKSDKCASHKSHSSCSSLKRFWGPCGENKSSHC